MRARRLWLRADGSEGLGFGHIMRCLALAEGAPKQGLYPQFVVSSHPIAERMPERFGFDVIQLSHRDNHAWLDSVAPDDLVVFDDYHFESADFEQVAQVGGITIAIDDMGHYRPADIIVNPNRLAREQDAGPREPCLLLGPRYALIRSEFLGYRRLRGTAARTLLLTLGGTDARDLTGKVAALLSVRRAFKRLLIVMGPGAPKHHLADDPAVEIVRDPQPVSAVFARADAAISAAGTTTWELLALGLPTAVVSVATNQYPVMQAAAEAGASIPLGTPAHLDTTLPAALAQLARVDVRRELSRRALMLVDGHGAERVLRVAVSVKRGES